MKPTPTLEQRDAVLRYIEQNGEGDDDVLDFWRAIAPLVLEQAAREAEAVAEETEAERRAFGYDRMDGDAAHEVRVADDAAAGACASAAARIRKLKGTP